MTTQYDPAECARILATQTASRPKAFSCEIALRRACDQIRALQDIVKRQQELLDEVRFWHTYRRTPVTNSIFEEAEAIVHGSRSRAYGPPERNLARIAAMWSALLDAPVTARQVALCMAALKLARDTHTPKRDNLVDVAGYIRLIELMESKT